jgi:hypothetical protein
LSQVLHYIDFLDGAGYVPVKPPQEWKSLRVELVFTQDAQRLSTNAFTWAGDTAEQINDYYAAGLTGGYGITEGLPYKAVLNCDGEFYDIVTACLNFADESAQYFCDTVEIPIRQTGNIDFLNDKADSFRFEILSRLDPSHPAYIGASDYIDVFYMVGKYPQSMEILMSSLSLFIMIKETIESIKRIADCIAAVLGGASGFAEAAAQIAALVIYLVAVIIALFTLIQALIDLIFPFVYYHKAMFVKTLLIKGFAYLGLGFSSSIFATGTVPEVQMIMPPKNYEGAKVGYPTPSTDVGYYDGTLGQLLRDLIEQYNGEVKIIGNTAHFETKNSFASTSTYKIPEVKTLGIYKTNLSSVSSNYVIEYEYDNIDLYDYNAPLNRITQVECKQTTVNNIKNSLLKGLTTRNIPFTLANVKTTTSRLETTMTNVFNKFSGFVGAISGLVSGSATPIPPIPSGANINCLQLDTHFTSQHKTFIYGGNGHIDPASSTYLGAPRLLELYHYTEVMKPIYGSSEGNQWVIYKGQVPMCCDEYLQILGNNYATYQGENARLISVSWNPYDGEAEIEFEVNRKYTNNLTATIVTPNSATIIV